MAYFKNLVIQKVDQLWKELSFTGNNKKKSFTVNEVEWTNFLHQVYLLVKWTKRQTPKGGAFYTIASPEAQ